jgi:hypothetical protein
MTAARPRRSPIGDEEGRAPLAGGRPGWLAGPVELCGEPGVEVDRSARGAVDLYWIPLGAGAHVVKASGALFEAAAAFFHGRARADLYHSALQVAVPEGRFVVEQAPVVNRLGDERGVVAEGPVGMRWAGRLRVFRYEVRRWCGGEIPDVAQAVASPVRLAADGGVARRVLDVVPEVPTPVWGRDELRAGEMWNSNSVISWVLSRAGIDLRAVTPPAGGRAPGWDAGLRVAARSRTPAADAEPRRIS